MFEVCQAWRDREPPRDEVEAEAGLLVAALEKEREAVGYLEETLHDP